MIRRVSVVRRRALITLAGEAALPGVLEAMAKETNRTALLGYENAILSLVEQPSAVALSARVRSPCWTAVSPSSATRWSG